MEYEGRIEERDPCVQDLHVSDEGDLWVLSSVGAHDQPAGALFTYDVFDPEGVFDRQVTVVCAKDPLVDRLVFVGARRALLLPGANDDDPEADVPAAGEGAGGLAQDVICYRLP